MHQIVPLRVPEIEIKDLEIYGKTGEHNQPTLLHTVQSFIWVRSPTHTKPYYEGTIVVA